MTDRRLAGALRAGSALLAEQCETGDAATHDALEHVVDVLAQRLAADAEEAAGDGCGPLPRLALDARPGPPVRPEHATVVSCHAMAMRLRQLAASLPDPGAPTATAVTRLARAVEEHALGLERLVRSWPQGASAARARRGEAAATRLQTILLGECRAVLAQVAG